MWISQCSSLAELRSETCSSSAEQISNDMDQGPKKLGNNQIIHYHENPTLPALPSQQVNRCFLGRITARWHSAKLTELQLPQKTPFGRMGRFNFAFIVCVSSVNGGMAPGEMETIFAAEYGFRMCTPFRLGSRDERRSSQKFSFPNPTAKTSHLGPRRVRRTEFF